MEPEREEECRAFINSTCDTFLNSSEGLAMTHIVEDNMQSTANGNGGSWGQNGKVRAGVASGFTTFRYSKQDESRLKNIHPYLLESCNTAIIIHLQ